LGEGIVLDYCRWQRAKKRFAVDRFLEDPGISVSWVYLEGFLAPLPPGMAKLSMLNVLVSTN